MGVGSGWDGFEADLTLRNDTFSDTGRGARGCKHGLGGVWRGPLLCPINGRALGLVFNEALGVGGKIYGKDVSER